MNPVGISGPDPLPLRIQAAAGDYTENRTLMGYNLDFTIQLQDEGAKQDGISRRVPARALVFGNLEAAKLEAEAVIAQSGGLTGKLYETSRTPSWFENGRQIATFHAGNGWTDARPVYPLG